MLFVLATLLLNAVPAKEHVLAIKDPAGSHVIASAVLLNKFTALTAAHAVGPERSAVFLQCGADDVSAVVSKRGRMHDLALLTLMQPCEDVVPVSLAAEDPVAETPVSIDGYPSGAHTHTKGKIKSYGLFSLPAKVFGPGVLWIAMVLEADVRPGNSGGPVLANGKLVGIVHGYHESAEGKPGIAVPLAAIVQFLSSDSPS